MAVWSCYESCPKQGNKNSHLSNRRLCRPTLRPVLLQTPCVLYCCSLVRRRGRISRTSPRGERGTRPIERAHAHGHADRAGHPEPHASLSRSSPPLHPWSTGPCPACLRRAATSCTARTTNAACCAPTARPSSLATPLPSHPAHVTWPHTTDLTASLLRPSMRRAPSRAALASFARA